VLHLPKYFGNLSNFISHAIPKFQKTLVIDRGNTKHVSLLKPHHANNDKLFPSQRLAQPGPILTDKGLKEFFVEEIINSQRHGHGWQFLVHWVGYGPKHNLWIASSKLTECKALDRWYELGSNGPDMR
jgi:Chromo (CHRromatin Organisation MOdifier) domain